MVPISPQDIPREMLEKLGAIRNIRFPRQGCTSDVAVIETGQGLFVLKRSRGEQYAEWLKREAIVLACLSKTPLPVPAVHQFVQRRDEHEGIQSWLLMEHLPGAPIRQLLHRENDSDTRSGILFEFGKMVRELHSTPCPDELKSGEKWLDRTLHQARFNLLHYEVDGTAELLERLRANKPADVAQTLIHGDCTIDNFLVHDGRISGIIDWSGGAFGDPRYDVALAVRPEENLFQSPEDHRAFFDGYGTRMLTDEEYDYFNGIYEFF